MEKIYQNYEIQKSDIGQNRHGTLKHYSLWKWQHLHVTVLQIAIALFSSKMNFLISYQCNHLSSTLLYIHQQQHTNKGEHSARSNLIMGTERARSQQILGPRIVNTSGYMAFLFYFIVKEGACSLIIFTHYQNALQASMRIINCTTQCTAFF